MEKPAIKLVHTLIAFLCVPFVFGGCVASVHPLYTDADVVFDVALVGVWQDAASAATYSLAASGKSYTLRVADASNTTDYVAHLVKLEGVLILDIFPKAPDQEKVSWPYFLALHTFVRVNKTESADELQVQFLGDSAIRELLAKTPQLIDHTERTDNDALPAARDKLIFTAKTQDIQSFFRNYIIADHGAWRSPRTVKRQTVRPPHSGAQGAQGAQRAGIKR